MKSCMSIGARKLSEIVFEMSWLVLHSLEQARSEGYLAMQFNYVVGSNAPAVELYRKLGFAIVGTLPKAFRHLELGLVDAYVMFRSLQ